MPSKISICKFIYFNLFFIIIGFIEYLFKHKTIEHNNNFKSILYLYIFILLRNVFLSIFIEKTTIKKEKINILHNNTNIYCKDLCKISFINTIFDIIISKNILDNKIENYIYSFYNPFYFITISLYYEIILDFFHYIIHRTLHKIPFLYKNIHKMHHERYDINVFHSFRMHTLDYLLGTLIPTYLSVKICNLTLIEFNILSVYQIFIELSGHSDKIIKSSSFIECIYLSKLLNIESYNVDHNKHHTFVNCNYSKRLSLWDKVFGTYIPGNNSSNIFKNEDKHEENEDKHEENDDKDKHKENDDKDKHEENEDKDKHEENDDKDKHEENEDKDKHEENDDKDKHEENEDKDKHKENEDKDKHEENEDKDKHEENEDKHEEK